LGKELGNLNSVRRSFSKLLSKILTRLCNVAFLPYEKKRSFVRILAAATVIVSLSLTLVAFGVINYSIIIRSGGTVNLPVGVGFYWDSDCSSPVSFIDWGDIQPGSTVNVTLFVRNEGGQAISLNITAENWNPIETTSYMTFDSDYGDQTINPQETIQITLSLTTSSSIEKITTFGFDINVTPNPI
jgi:hypothetical protein